MQRGETEMIELMFECLFELLYRIVFGYCNFRVCNRYVVIIKKNIKATTQAHRTNRIKKQQTIE